MSSSAQAPTGAVTIDTDDRPSLTVLSGFWPATFAVARSLLAAEPSSLLVRHDITRIRDGLVRRTVSRGADIVEDEQIEVRHHDVFRILREDVVPTLVRLSRDRPDDDLVLVLPDVVEPEAVVAACTFCRVDGTPVTDLIRIDSCVTVVDAEHLLDGLASDDELSVLGIQAAADDHRTVADVVLRQIEYADTLVLWGESRNGTFDTDRLAVLLQRLAPWAAHVRLDSDRVDADRLHRQLRHTHRHRAEIHGVLNRGLQGYSLGVHEPEPDCGVVSAVFRARRPFHPQRLHDVLENVNAEVIRSRGHLWLASQPDSVVAWEFGGGGLAMGSLGHWLVSLPEDRWEHVDAQRSLAAAVDWDPYYGDRHQHLVFIGLGLDAVELHRTLAGCLLTDAELADGEDTWRTYHDPFTGCFPLDTELTQPTTQGAQPA
ncbi:CobW family GTP-binding protein [Micromonospora craniellae]|uniref:Cobalamin biosynthesis protein CobW n=1 Tax=Micromonospora craniellae TaxID=2294034 RepID=A0A372FZ27_9ACTN|nr:GTP-binding protein [Micromonospora craniellae]QOC93427.1 GTP-binding protein [Micromonospora craniellae]RFS45874.1 cobalamin biosynthesis protein CobW [Micromonospora craniellae]